jgi:BirA family transcriptional regulator, biotin operon repressor / biotin---[acetyl-CoA-carboxylase] ligase
VTVAGTGDQRTTSPVVSRRERFARVGSTNDVVRDWLLAGVPEVCLAIADEQTAGRGREDRRWLAPAGAALLLSLGFRPTWLDPQLVWRLPAIVSLAMAEAAEEVAGLTHRTIQLKWPNDLVIDPWDLDGIPWRNFDTGGENRGDDVRKLGGVLGETAGLGSADVTAIVGIGVNVDWRRDDFPPELAASMTSLLDASSGRTLDRDVLLELFLAQLAPRVRLLREDRFDVEDWEARQLTTGHLVEVQAPDGGVHIVRAIGVDGRSGALVVDDRGTNRHLVVGEIRRLRLAKV